MRQNLSKIEQCLVGGAIIKIVVISDPQINFNDMNTALQDIEILRECFKNMNVDAVVVCGDITENARPQEMNAFFDAFKKYCPTKKLFAVPGNMDGVYDPKTQNAYFKAYERFLGKKIETLYFLHEFANCFLIGISPEPIDDGTITDAQFIFLEDALRKANECSLPALVFCHYQITETINTKWKYASLGSDSPRVRTILEKYNGKVVFFSGHTHRGLIKEIGGSVITKRNVTYISTPSICMPDVEHYNADNNNKGTGYFVEADKINVIINGFDFLNNAPLNSFNLII